MQKKRRRVIWQDKCVRTSCWPKELPLVAGGSGVTASVPKPTCGQEPSVGDAKPTFQQDCTGSICRPCPQEICTVGYVGVQSLVDKRNRVARVA